MILTVEAAQNDPNIPVDHSIFHYFQPRLWVDDATWCLPFKDVLDFFQDAKRLGPIYSFNFNRKTQALLSTNGIDPQH